MGFRSETRGVSTLVGFVLLFGLGIVALSTYQAVHVPAQNTDVEFEHNQQLQSDLGELRNALLDVRAEGEVREHAPIDVRIGTRYPTRMLAVNPPPAVGSLETDATGTIEIRNVDVDGSFSGDPETELLSKPHRTNRIVYEPGYTEYGTAPTTVFEHSLLYNRFDDATLAATDQRLIEGDTGRLNLVLFDGNLSESGLRTTIDPKTIDGPTDPVPIVQSGEEPVELEISTDEPDVWIGLIGETFEDGEPGASAAAGDGSVTVGLDPDTDWELQATRVAIDGTVEPSETLSRVESFEREQDNPFEIAGVRYGGASLVDGENARIELSFENVEDDAVGIELARVNFLDDSDATEADLTATEDVSEISATLEVGGESRSLDPEIALEPGSNEIYLDFDENVNDAWFVLSVQYDTGDRTQYFVAP